MESPYYNNDMNDAVWLYTSFSRAGAVQIAKTMRDKFGCVLLEQPMEREDGMWITMFTNPFLREEDV